MQLSKEKGQQRAASSTFRVLAQAQYQARAVAAKRATLESRGFILERASHLLDPLDCRTKPSFSAVVCPLDKRHKSMAKRRAALTTKRLLARLLLTMPAAS